MNKISQLMKLLSELSDAQIDSVLESVKGMQPHENLDEDESKIESSP